MLVLIPYNHLRIRHWPRVAAAQATMIKVIVKMALLQNKSNYDLVSFCENNFKDQEDYKDKEESNPRDNEIVYLSPDAVETLDSCLPPPCKVVVGMLVDRSISLYRSSKRASQIKMGEKKSGPTNRIRCCCLPLSDTMTILRVRNNSADKCLDDANTAIDNDEPLNIDTVMTLMRYWYEDYSLMHDKNHDSSLFAEERHQTLNTDIEYSERNNKAVFINAATKSLLLHQDRHPNRTLHK